MVIFRLWLVSRVIQRLGWAGRSKLDASLMSWQLTWADWEDWGQVGHLSLPTHDWHPHSMAASD